MLTSLKRASYIRLSESEIFSPREAVTNAGKPVTKDSPITNLSGRIHCEKCFIAIVKTIRVHVEIYLADFLKTNPAKFAA